MQLGVLVPGCPLKILWTIIAGVEVLVVNYFLFVSGDEGSMGKFVLS
jgi:hypothetical protein